jgi:hypothetical protein
MVSMMTLMTDGSYVEAGVVGREGLVGWPLLMGSDRSSSEARVRIPRDGGQRFHGIVGIDSTG